MQIIHEYVKKHGEYFGTDGFAYYMYGLIKMIKPDNIIELGTGYGVTSFMAALACKENNKGKIITIDDGSHFKNFNHKDFIINKIDEFNLNNFIEFKNFKLNLDNFIELNYIKNVDIFFNDVDASPLYFLNILNWLLPRLNNTTYFFIDGGATFWPCYCAIELTIDKLNKNKIPLTQSEKLNFSKESEEIIKKYSFSSYYLKKNTENVMNPKQDSFALIKIERTNITY